MWLTYTCQYYPPQLKHCQIEAWLMYTRTECEHYKLIADRSFIYGMARQIATA